MPRYFRVPGRGRLRANFRSNNFARQRSVLRRFVRRHVRPRLNRGARSRTAGRVAFRRRFGFRNPYV